MIAPAPAMSFTAALTMYTTTNPTTNSTITKRIVNALAAAVMLCCAAAAHAALVVDTGVPNGNPIGAYAFDSSDFYAGQITFTNAAQIGSIVTHVLGGSAGERFTVALCADSASHLPGAALYQATATFAADGWNGGLRPERLERRGRCLLGRVRDRLR